MNSKTYRARDKREITVRRIREGDGVLFRVDYRLPGGDWKPHPAFSPFEKPEEAREALDLYAGFVQWEAVEDGD